MAVKNIFWDFDGVILDSQKIRVNGFKEIFKNYPKDCVNKLIEYHINNGGLSRFNKIAYFFNDILKQDISNETLQDYANKFSDIMRKELINKKYLIQDSITFIENNYTKYNFHILSGSEQNELRFLCDKLEINKFFLSILGSPTPKTKLMHDLIMEQKYNTKQCVMIGDSIHDFKAASANNVAFYGYNNESLRDVGEGYIDSFLESSFG